MVGNEQVMTLSTLYPRIAITRLSELQKPQNVEIEKSRAVETESESKVVALTNDVSFGTIFLPGPYNACADNKPKTSGKLI